MTTQNNSPLTGIFRKFTDSDKVIWIVLLMLMMISIVAIFSSTATKAIQAGSSPASVFWKHLLIVAAGLLLVVLLSAISNIKFFRAISRWGFLLSFFLLLCMMLHIRIGNIISVPTINGAVRSIKIFSFNLQVFEVVKIAMVMYLAWAVQVYESGQFKTVRILGGKWPKAFGWMKSALGQRWVFIFGPMLIVTAMVLSGSTGSAIIICTVMFVTILIGGMKWLQVIGAASVFAFLAALIIGIHILSNGNFIHRMQTAFSRCGVELPYPDPKVRSAHSNAVAIQNANLDNLEEGSEEWRNFIDKKRQPAAAELAIVEGGRKIIGKLPGKSTQKYKVSMMFEDYMFSFIVEEYGLIGCIVILILYMSLFARGRIITRMSPNRYAKACVGGFVFLITLQAMFHIAVNCRILPVSGQTLPLISHGRCSFLCFCLAFGIILSISEQVKNKIKREQAEQAKLIEADDIQLAGVLEDEIDGQLESKNEGNN